MPNYDTLIIHNIVALTEVIVTRSCRNICKMDLVAIRPSYMLIA